MKDCYIIHLTNKKKVVIPGEIYKNHRFMISDEIEKEEHWFDENKAREFYDLEQLLQINQATVVDSR